MRKIFIILFLIPFYISAQYLSVNGKYVAYNGRYVKNTAVVTTCDADALTYIANAGITDDTQKQAICDLVKDLKDSSLWSKGKMFHIFWDSFNKSKYNLLNSSFTLVEQGSGITYTDSAGAEFHGTGYYTTGFNPSVEMTANSMCMGACVVSEKSLTGGVTMGCTDGTSYDYITNRQDATNAYAAIDDVPTRLTYVSGALNTATGLFMANRNAINYFEFRQNAGQLSQTATANGQALCNLQFYIGSANLNNSPILIADHTLKLSFVFDGLSIVDRGRLENILYDFLLALNLDFKQYAGYGDSHIAGIGATVPTVGGWFYKVCANKGVHPLNFGYTGSTMISAVPLNPAGGINVYDNLGGSLPLFGYNSRYRPYIFIQAGLNDVGLNFATYTDTLFETQYIDVVERILAAGYPSDSIILCCNAWIDEVNFDEWLAYGVPVQADNIRNQAFVQKIKDVANAKGCKVVDFYATILNNGGNLLLDVSQVHPNDSGHNYMYLDVLTIINTP